MLETQLIGDSLSLAREVLASQFEEVIVLAKPNLLGCGAGRARALPALCLPVSRWGTLIDELAREHSHVGRDRALVLRAALAARGHPLYEVRCAIAVRGRTLSGLELTLYPSDVVQNDERV